MDLSLEDIVRKLQDWSKNGIRSSNGKPQAGVLVPFYEINNQPYLLLTLRSSKLKKHSGQISFPGGKVDPDDNNIIETALRESKEEVGIDPSSVDILGIFHDFRTPYYTSITPIMAIIKQPVFYINSPHEIAEIIQVPIEDLMNEEIHHIEFWELNGVQHPVHFFEWHDATGKKHNIWGATAGVINHILNILRS